MTNKQVKIWHISDIHMGANARVADSRVDARVEFGREFKRRIAPTHKIHEEFWKKVEARIKTDRLPDLWVISGDITTHGDPAGLDALRRRLERIDKLARGDANGKEFASARVVVVPGNHDVTWEKEFGVKLDEKARYGNFAKHLGTYATPRLIAAKTRKTCFSRSGNVLVYALNSTRNCGVFAEVPEELNGTLKTVKRALGRNPDQYARLVKSFFHYDAPYVNLADLKEMKRDIDEADPKKECLRIVTLHHHLVPHKFQGVEVKPFELVMNAGEVLDWLHQSGVHLVLHGHKHIAAESVIGSNSSSLIHVWGAPSAAGDHYPEIASCVNGFSEIIVESASETVINVSRTLVPNLGDPTPRVEANFSVNLREPLVKGTSENVARLGKFPDYLERVSSLLRKAQNSDEVLIACDFPAPALFSDTSAYSVYEHELFDLIKRRRKASAVDSVRLIYPDATTRAFLQDIQFGSDDDFRQLTTSPLFQFRFQQFRQSEVVQQFGLVIPELGNDNLGNVRKALFGTLSIIQAKKHDALDRNASVVTTSQVLTEFSWIVGNEAVWVISDLAGAGKLGPDGYFSAEQGYYSNDPSVLDRLRVRWWSNRALAMALTRRNHARPLAARKE
jgi:3',5'-cyclic AMP phosphodiesterase CpdA